MSTTYEFVKGGQPPKHQTLFLIIAARGGDKTTGHWDGVLFWTKNGDCYQLNQAQWLCPVKKTEASLIPSPLGGRQPSETKVGNEVRGGEDLPSLSLTKEGFWAEIETRWPGVFHRFTGWIDEYKKKVDWDNLFAGKVDRPEFVGFTGAKFHDLPIGMQLGVLLQYCIEEDHRYDLMEGQPPTMEKMIGLVKEWFGEEEAAAIQDHHEGKYIEDMDHPE